VLLLILGYGGFGRTAADARGASNGGMRLRGRGARETRACPGRDPWPVPARLVGLRSRAVGRVARKKTTLCLVRLTEGAGPSGRWRDAAARGA
jgi:hypothetical protein